MVIGVRDLDENLKNFRLSKKNILQVCDVVDRQLQLCKSLNLKPTKVSLIIVGKKIDGIDVIRVFNKSYVLGESLDASQIRLKNVSNMEDWNTNFIFWITILEDGDYIDLVKCRVDDLKSIKCKKVKSVTYALTDRVNIIKIEISLQDIKGAEYDVLRKAVVYTFNKQTKKKLEDIDCIAVDYS